MITLFQGQRILEYNTTSWRSIRHSLSFRCCSRKKSIKAQEKASNNILAGQLEASVLTLAQSDIQGVGEQIKAVLGFAQQLRRFANYRQNDNKYNGY